MTKTRTSPAKPMSIVILTALCICAGAATVFATMAHAQPRRVATRPIVVSAQQMGPIRLGMTRAQVVALGILSPHPQYSAMTIPYHVIYEADLVVGVELSLLHAPSPIRVGRVRIPMNATQQQVVTLFGDCGPPDRAEGGSTWVCHRGQVRVEVGSGNVNEVWLRIGR